jgi:hypothetical protein
MSEVTDSQVSVAVRLLADLDVPILSCLPSSRALGTLDVDAQLAVSNELFFSRESLSVAVELLRSLSVRHDLKAGQRERLMGTLSLGLIGLGRFEEAMAAISQGKPDPKLLEIQDAFNYAMAEWGQTKVLPIDLMARVVELDKMERSSSGANYDECLSIALYAVGNCEAASQRLSEARQQIMTLPRSEFSAWRYLKADPAQFMRDLDGIEKMIDGAQVLPEFMQA